MSCWTLWQTRRRLSRLASIIVAGAALLPALVSAEQVVGTIKTRVRQGASAAVPVVYAERLDAPTPERPGTFTMTQKSKGFAPRVLAVPNGSTVSFPNEDPIFHNVFSLSTPQPFDLGLYRSGASKTRTFTEPAAYHVFCNIHPQMVAFLVVAPSSWVATAGPDGTWRLDVPPGRYRITALSERASPVAIEIAVGSNTPQAPPMTLDESVAVTTPHLNKYGKPYPKAAYTDK
jgi:plastocyanin